ncbi:hypothetical protein M758_5G018600 [Ceratodon purpureus]|nr:hypothetical protein M758_5G018600 [Ceratodon purpureus]
MALLRSLSFLLLASAFVLTFTVSEYRVAATSAKVDNNGYNVKTVLDGNKLGLFVYNLLEDTNGDTSVIALDSTRSSILRVSLPFSQGSVIERISGSVEGSAGYRDGPINEALFNHPRKLTLDSEGNIYVADPKNGAVRMITRTGLVTTIAGGSNRTGHSDGEGSDVTFSNDFEVTYLPSTCTLAIADRGNRMIREIQLPQFNGRCSGAAPNSPGSPFQSAAPMLFLVGIVGIVMGVAGTMFTISTHQLERWQSKFSWAITEGPSWARSSMWKKTMDKEPASSQQVKETSLTTRSSVTRNAAVEHLVWSPALIMEIVITLFEKFLYVLLYSLSLFLRLLCSQPFHKLFHRSCPKTIYNPDTETDLLGLHEQAYNPPSMSRRCSVSLIPAIWRICSMGSLFIRFQVKKFQQASPQVKSDFLILEDLIDFSEPISSDDRPVECAPVGGAVESTPADVVSNELKMDSMVEKCLAELVAPSPHFS